MDCSSPVCCLLVPSCCQAADLVWLAAVVSANATHWINIRLLLGHRLRLWPNNKRILGPVSPACWRQSIESSSLIGWSRSGRLADTQSETDGAHDSPTGSKLIRWQFVLRGNHFTIGKSARKKTCQLSNLPKNGVDNCFQLRKLGLPTAVNSTYGISFFFCSDSAKWQSVCSVWIWTSFLTDLFLN